jgi:predicted PurR-regulated permease PerM
VVSALVKKKINRIIAIFLVLIVIAALIGVGIYYTSMQSKSLVSDIPQLTEKFNRFLENAEIWFTGLTGISAVEQLQMAKENMDNFISTGGNFLSNAVDATSSLLSFISIVPIYAFFMLLYKDNFKKFLMKMDARTDSNLMEIMKEIQKMVYSYMSGLLIVITIIATLNSVGLIVLGIDYAIFMGILSAILTIIPYIGIILGALLPLLVALLTKDSIWYPIGVVGVFALVQFLEGNFITPNIVGNKVNVNPLAAIISLLVGGACWGIVGMILAIPLLGITQIVFRHFESLEPYAVLLAAQQEDNPENGKKIKMNIKKIFRRSKG